MATVKLDLCAVQCGREIIKIVVNANQTVRLFVVINCQFFETNCRVMITSNAAVRSNDAVVASTGRVFKQVVSGVEAAVWHTVNAAGEALQVPGARCIVSSLDLSSDKVLRTVGTEESVFLDLDCEGTGSEQGGKDHVLSEINLDLNASLLKSTWPLLKLAAKRHTALLKLYL